MSIEEHYRPFHYSRMNHCRKEMILKMIGESPNQVILDIGCSSGYLGEAVKQKLACKFYGMDISSEAVAMAEKVLDGAWQFNLEEDFSQWPEELKAKPYDLIVASEVLEHLFEPEKLLAKLNKLAKLDKSIIITVPNLLFWKNRIKIILGRFNYTDHGLMDRGHIHFFTWASLKSLINNAGYQLAAVKNHCPAFKWLGRIWPGLFAYQFIVKINSNKVKEN
ncbi:MAG: class I SAM-dependent methyltransferase [Candidatus Komeilibacteria bacterium]|nr:class I SAM-dependent methyltransferase [Candidatus Komeilibacteria bacterium]